MAEFKSVRDVPLDALPAAAGELVKLVKTSGFKPDCLLYVETGARLLAFEVASLENIGTLAVRIQRQGSWIKSRVAGVAAWLPKRLKDMLRRAEARFLWKRMSHRRHVFGSPVSLEGACVLVLDDAVDTGTTIAAARSWAVSCGAKVENIRVAALTATTPAAEDIVDFFLYSEICRFPWSSDSPERAKFSAIYERIQLPRYPGSFV